MPLRILIPALAMLLGAAPSSHAFDFTLHRVPQPADVRRPAKMYFLDGDSKIFVEIPSDWTVSDSPQALDCLPPHANCHVRIELAGSKPWEFDEPGKILLRKKVLDSLPDGAKEVQALPEQSNLIGLNGWSNLEVAHSYDFFGQRLHRAVLFFNLPEKRIWQVTISAPEEYFADIHEQTRQMLYGLFEPAKMLSPSALQRYNDGVQD